MTGANRGGVADLVRWALLVLGAVLLALVCVGPAAADPDPSPPPPVSEEETKNPTANDHPECDLLTGPAKGVCIESATNGNKAPSVVTGTVDTVLHPIDALAEACAEAATFFTGKLAKAISEPTRADMTNPGFVRHYAVAFAASTFMTLILWLLAVMKRAIRGVPLWTALGEAIGYLWLVVAVSAFMPLALLMAVSSIDSITTSLGSNTQEDTKKFFGSVATDLESTGGLGGGPIVLILASGLTMIAAVALWVELLVRDAMIYIGAILAPLVFSGLVDKNLWSSTKRWVGLMVAVLLAKPILVIVLGLGIAVGAGGQDPLENVLLAVTIMGLAVMCGITCYRWVPGVGDEIGRLQYDRRTSTMPGGLPGSGSPRGGAIGAIRQGLATHGARSGPSPSRGSSGNSGSAAVGAGVAAHGSRQPQTQATPQRPSSPPSTGGAGTPGPP